jgi:hypothetical protein
MESHAERASRIQRNIKEEIELFWYLLTLNIKKSSNKAKANKIRNKKIFQPRLKGNQYFGGRRHKRPKTMVPRRAPISGFMLLLPWMPACLKGGGVTRKYLFKKCLNKGHINDSPVISIISKLVGFDSGSSGLSPSGGSKPKSIPKVLI